MIFRERERERDEEMRMNVEGFVIFVVAMFVLSSTAVMSSAD